jgi:hypothetical protein
MAMAVMGGFTTPESSSAAAMMAAFSRIGAAAGAAKWRWVFSMPMSSEANPTKKM